MNHILSFSIFEKENIYITKNEKFISNESLNDKKNKISGYKGNFDNLKGKCVREEIWPFVNYVLQNQNKLLDELKIDLKTLNQLTKASIGIIWKETFFGKYSTRSDETILSQMEKSELISSAMNWLFSSINKKPSLGLAQFQKETWDEYGLDKRVGDYVKSARNPKLQGLAVLFSLCDRYKMALKKGLQKQPSRNQILEKYKIIEKINGTGDNALDLSILGHNYGEWVVTKWCETSNPLFSAPAGKKEIEPFKTEQEFKNWASDSALMKKITDPNLKRFPGKLKTFQDKIIPNYFPNLAGGSDSRSGKGKRTSIGYLEGVCKYMKSLQCLDEKFT